jgi:polyisoprenyl-phosphate glycosyltransferase
VIFQIGLFNPKFTWTPDTRSDMSVVSLSSQQQRALSLISIVVPAYNEDSVILEFNRRLSLVRHDLCLPSEVIFVNDGSTDDTLGLLQALKAADPTIGIVDLSRNFGKEIALTAGLDYARGDVVVIIDADLQHPPELIPEFIARWREEEADVVYGRRASRAGESRAKKIVSRAFYRVINPLSGRLVAVDATDFCILSRRVVDALARVRERHRFMKGLFGWIGYRQIPVLYEPDPRFAGVSKWNYWRLWNFSLEGITSFSIAPLKAATYVGLFVAISSILYGVYMVIQTIMVGNPVPGFPSLLVAMLFLGGLQLIFLGIIGEYLGRTFNEVKQRPLYLVRQWDPSARASRLIEAATTEEREAAG